MMRTIEITEILSLYRKCSLSGYSSNTIRTDINRGTLDNKLNSSYDFLNRENKTSVWSNTAIDSNNDSINK